MVTWMHLSVIHTLPLLYYGIFKFVLRCDNQFTTIYPADVVLLEGILVFYFPEIRELFHMKLFVDTDSDTRLARRGKKKDCVYFIWHVT